MSYQLDTEDWKEIRKDFQLKKAKIRNQNSYVIWKFCIVFEINYEEKTPYHFRLSKDCYNTVDVFPTSSKIHVLKPGNNKFIKCDIIEFLSKHFRIN